MLQSAFGVRSTAREVVAGHDLRGKRICITGGSTGIGYETARALLSAHAEVILAGRSQAKGEQAVQALHTAYPESQVQFLPLDLDSLASVRQTGDISWATGTNWMCSLTTRPLWPPLWAIPLMALSSSLRPTFTWRIAIKRSCIIRRFPPLLAICRMRWTSTMPSNSGPSPSSWSRAKGDIPS